jgi:hypothetical protein
VKEGLNGEFFDEQTVESLMEKIKSFDASKYDPTVVRNSAMEFDSKEFQKKIKEFVEQKYANRT